ncbi:MAG: hypothetical protein K6348_01535 [Deferribacterales bacterium]
MGRIKIEYVVISFVVLVLLLLSSGVRFYQLHRWEKEHPEYFKNKVVPLTTLDGYYWVRLGKSLDNISMDEPDRYRGYPDYPYKYRVEADNLLVFMINKFGKLIVNYYLSSIYIVIITSSLFIIPLFLYFYSIAGPSVAILSAFMTTFSYAYFYRTFLGRVDTDALNLFFPFIISYLIYLITKINGVKRYILAVFMGLNGYLFMWWYKYPGFILIYAFLMFIYLIINRMGILKTIILTSIFVVCSDPRYFLIGLDNIKYFVFGSKYFAGEGIKDSGIVWPNIAEFIGETQRKGVNEIFIHASGNSIIGVVGLIGMFIMLLKKKSSIIPLSPILVLGLISFKSGLRFTMYLSPFVYAGLGYLIYFLSEYFFRNVAKIFEQYVKYFANIASTIISIITSVFLFIYFSGVMYKPVPSVPIKMQNVMLELKDILGNGGVIYTWWDYGYVYQDLTNVATYHDGGIQGKSRGYFISLGLADGSQQKLYNIISYFDHKGFGMFEGKQKVDIYKILADIETYDKKVMNKNIYIAVSYDMVSKFDGINFFAKWDFKNKTSNYTDYEKVECYIKDNIIKCNGKEVDLDRGVWEEEQLGKIFIVNKDTILKEYDYKNNGRILQIVLDGDKPFFSYLADEEIFKSNFNQLYFFDKYDNNLFEKVYDRFPMIRVYRVRG